MPLREPRTCEKCNGETWFNAYCGAWTCEDCQHHDGLARCYCGWAESGGNGRAELSELGETIEPEGDEMSYQTQQREDEK